MEKIILVRGCLKQTGLSVQTATNEGALTFEQLKRSINAATSALEHEGQAKRYEFVKLRLNACLCELKQ